jgi:hypothetical protein
MAALPLNRSSSVVNQSQVNQASTRPGSPSSPKNPKKGSLNYVVKKKEAARIDRENEKIMKNLLSQTPSFTQMKMDEH